MNVLRREPTSNHRLPQRRVEGDKSRSAATPYTDKLFLDKLGKIRTHNSTICIHFYQQLLTREGNKTVCVDVL